MAFVIEYMNDKCTLLKVGSSIYTNLINISEGCSYSVCDSKPPTLNPG